MRRRDSIGLLALTAVAPAACTAFSAASDAPMNAADGGSTIDGGATGRRDAESDAMAKPGSPEAPTGQPRVGQGCEGRVPTPNICDDYEHGLPNTIDSAQGGIVSIANTASKSIHALHATAPGNTSAHAYADYPILANGPITALTFSYDLHVADTLEVGTEVVQLYLPALRFCAVQTRLTDTPVRALVFEEFCGDPEKSEHDLGTVPLPTAALPYWVNVYVSVDFATKNVVMSVRSEDGTAQVVVSKITFVTAGSGPAFDVGIGFFGADTGPTVLDLDNFAASWH